MEHNNSEKKVSISDLIVVLLLIVCSISLVISLSKFFDYMDDIHSAESLTQGLKHDEAIVVYPVDDDGVIILPAPTTDAAETTVPYDNPYQDLYDENSDFVGWLYIPDTNIDYPVMHTPDDEQYYIHRNFRGEYDSSGTLFCSANSSIENPSMNIVIYGHHMRAKTMFGALSKYVSEDFYSNHRYLYFSTNWWSGVYEVVGAFSTDISDDTYKYYAFNDGTEAEFDEWISNTIERTPYDTNTSDIHYGDQFLTLSTCAYHTSNGRFVVIARRIQ